MSTFTPQTKNTAITLNTLAKNTSTLGRITKAGQPWQYGQNGLTYDGATDPLTGLPVYYDSEGVTPTWSTLIKS